MINSILDKVLQGGEIGFADAQVILDASRDDIFSVMSAADRVRREFCGDRIDLCSLINAKSGLCSEDCKFCAQASKYNTGCETYPLVEVDEIVKTAEEAKNSGATNFCIVISGEGPTKEEFEKIKEAIIKVKEQVGIKMDCSLGVLDKEMIEDLRAIGIDRYNHNLETSENFYRNICTTHPYSKRMENVKALKSGGLEPCCGGIIGLGEKTEDRISLAFKLKELDVECVPINILNPRKGTPLESVSPLSPFDIIKTVALFRLILKKPVIKIAGGRESSLRDLQAMAFMAGANGMIIGGYLTTKGRSAEEDLRMVRDLGFKLNKEVT